jgi:hypothetical protein
MARVVARGEEDRREADVRAGVDQRLDVVGILQVVVVPDEDLLEILASAVPGRRASG